MTNLLTAIVEDDASAVKRLLRAAVAIVGAMSVLLTGCSTGRIAPPTMERVGFWQPHLLYLESSPHSRLYVEVDSVEGCEPGDDTLNKLREFLAAYCRKPAGIEIVRGDVIPLA